MRATIRVTGLNEATLQVRGMGLRALRPEPALRSSGTLRDLQESERRRFAKPFRPAASRDWVREKRQRGLDPRTLRATGRLEAALVNAQDGVGVSVFNRELRWGFLYGKADGATLRKVNSLAAKRAGRKHWRFVVIDKISRERIAMRIQIYVAEGVGHGL